MCRSCEGRAGWHAEMICLVWRLREQARSHRVLRHIPEVNRLTNQVGASLLAKALGQALTQLDVPTLSRAGSLLQRGWVSDHAQRFHHQGKRRRRLAAAGVVEVEATERFAPVFQHSDQTPFSQVRAELVFGQVGNP